MTSRKRYPCERESWHTLTANWRSLEQRATARGLVTPVRVAPPTLLPIPHEREERTG